MHVFLDYPQYILIDYPLWIRIVEQHTPQIIHSFIMFYQ